MNAIESFCGESNIDKIPKADGEVEPYKSLEEFKRSIEKLKEKCEKYVEIKDETIVQKDGIKEIPRNDADNIKGMYDEIVKRVEASNNEGLPYKDEIQQYLKPVKNFYDLKTKVSIVYQQVLNVLKFLNTV